MGFTHWFKQRARPGIFILGGVLLLAAGGFLIYPYAYPGPVMAPATRTALSSESPVSATAPLTRPPTLTPAPTNQRPPVPTAPPAIPDRIVIPAIELDAPVVPVSPTVVTIGGQEQSTWGLPQTRAAGWHETSAPLMVPGNTVLNGHNTAHGEVFRDLYKLEKEDLVIVHSAGISRTYAISETLILPEAGQPLEVRIENARYIQPTDDERLTLVTCHPYGSLRNRLIVIALPASQF